MKKILIVSTVSRQFYLFEQGNIEVLKSLGFEIHCAANFEDENERLDALDIVRHHFDIQRSPFSIKNIKAYKQLKKIMKLENFDAVHCHSPMGGVLARLAAKSVGIFPVIYTAHGFHFYKGSPIINWLAYYPIEKFLSRYTDVLITINQEDYERAKKFKAKKIEYVPGIGVDTKKLSGVTVDRGKKREELGVPRAAFVILSVGELNKNKNHEVIIKALAKIDNRNVFYIICGCGDREDYLRQLAKLLGIYDKVMFLGFRNDVPKIYKAADIFAFPSYREGLSVSLMEAMAAGLPVICSKIRGNTDLIEVTKGGYLLEPNDIDGFVASIEKLMKIENINSRMSLYNFKKITQFDKEDVKKKMNKVYSEVF
ncbi:glycosyltransferase family 4 protein [Vallitalea sediminicola]